VKLRQVDVLVSQGQNIVDATTSAHHNTHLSMSLKRTGFADRDAIPRGALGSAARAR
jgi:hypothetical protein